LKLGIAFVAMRRNIADLPALIRLGQQLGASKFSISNVLPHTEELRKEILFQHALDDYRSAASSCSPEVDFPRMDLSREVVDALQKTAGRFTQLLYRGQWPDPAKPTCPFLEKGSVSIRWDGEVSPCLPLMHSHQSYLGDRLRISRAWSVGNIREESLDQLWRKPVYAAFRQRLQDFDFSPCTYCNSCGMADSNLEDCFGNVHPACGGCLWAHGFIQCP
jgi:MoaA/NifB/PqqE/SkfB family radical SAM enzyme